MDRIDGCESGDLNVIDTTAARRWRRRNEDCKQHEGATGINKSMKKFQEGGSSPQAALVQ